MAYFHYSGDNRTIISGSAEDDNFYNLSSSVTINAGAGNDFISNSNTGSSTSINGDDGDDKIESGGKYSTLNGNAGNDTIKNWGESADMYGGDGNDILINSTRYVRMYGDAGNDSLTNENGSPWVTLDGGDGDDSISNNSTVVAIYGGEGNDYIVNNSAKVTINGEGGNDVIHSGAWEIKVDGGDGNDTIHASAQSTINGGDGDDYIYGAFSALLAGNKGNDAINIVERLQTVRYADGDGDDTIYGFKEKLASYYDYPNVLQITEGSVSSVSSIGSDAILKVGDGSIRLKNVAGRTFKFVDAEGNAVDTVIGSVITVKGSLANKESDVMLRLDGDDIVTLNGARQIIDVGEGKNTIVGYDEDDTIRLDGWWRGYRSGSGSDNQVSVNGSDVIVGGDENSLVIKGAAKKKIKLINTDENILYVTPSGATVNADSSINTIVGTVGNVLIDIKNKDVTVRNYADKVTVRAEGSRNNIENSGSNVSVKTGAGDDYIGMNAEDGINNITVDAGDGDNSIEISAGKWFEGDSVSNGENFSLKSGAGNDRIVLYNTDKAKLNVGGGNDTIEISQVGRSTIDAGDGDNIISIYQYGYETTDLKIMSGAGVDSIHGVGLIGVSVNAGAGNDTIEIDGEESRNFTLNGGADDDTIRFDNERSGDKVNAALLGGDGNDSISNTGSSVTIDGGSGDDTIENDGSNVTILGGAGNDSIVGTRYRSGAYIFIDGGDGNDTIGGGSFGTVNGGKGNDLMSGALFYRYASGDGDDTIEDYSNSWILNLTSGSVSGITAEDDGFKIKIGSGSIRVSNFDEGSYNYRLPLVVMDSKNNFSAWQHNDDGTFAQIAAGTSMQIGDNYYNFKSKTTVDAGDVEGVSNYGSNVKINAGDAYVNNYGSNVTVDSTHEVMNFLGSNVVLNSDGYVYNYGSVATINSSSVDNYGDKVLINATTASSGDDFLHVYNSGSNVTINAIDEGIFDEYSSNINNSGNKVLINATLAGTGEMSSISNGGSDVTIRSSSLDNVIGNAGRNVSIDAGAGDDSIDNSGASVLIDAGVGNDSIRSTSDGEDVTIIAGAGNDTIRNYSHRASLVGGAGNDVIRDGGYYTTINAGAGNDILSLDGGAVIQYKNGDGNDTVYDYYYEGDRILLDGAYSTVLGKEVREDVEGDEAYDVIVKVGSGSITFVAASNQTLNITGGTLTGGGGSTSGGGDDTVPSGITYDAKKKPAVITVTDYSGTVDANDYSEKVTTIDASKSSTELVLKANDKKGTVINAGDGDSTLIGGAKDDKFYGGEGVNVFAYSVGGGKDAVYNYEAQDIVSIDGATFDQMKFVDAKEVVKITFDGSKSQLTVNKTDTNGAITFDIDGETYNYGVLPTGVKFDDEKKKTALIVEETAEDGVIVDAGAIVSTAKTINGSAASGAVHLIGNDNSNIIQAGNHGSTLFGGRSTKAVADKLYGGNGADVFMWSTLDGADVIYKFDGKKDLVVLDGVTELDSKNIAVSSNKVVVTINNQKLTLDNPDGRITFVDTDGNTLNSVGLNLPGGVNYNAKKTAVIVEETASDIAEIDLTDGYVSTVKEVDASAYTEPINIVGNAQADVIRAGAGGSTLYGGKGDTKKPSADKLYGSTVDAADVFVYAKGDGADVIYNFDGRQGDYVVLDGVDSLDSGAVKVSATKVEVTINKQKLTLDNPNGEINFVDGDGETLYSVGINFPEGVGYDKKKAMITVDGSAADIGTIDLSSPKYFSTVKEINATAYGGALNLVGNSNANILRAGEGGSTLNGGYAIDAKGNKKVTADKLYGSTVDAADVFVWDSIWGGGDQIFNYNQAEGDIISVTGAGTLEKSAFKISSKNVVMSAGTGKLTINNAAGNPIVVSHNGELITYASLPSGVGYDTKSKNKVMTIGGAFEGTFDAAAEDYLGTAATIDASTSENEIELIGNKKIKAMVGGAGSTTMRGSTAADIFNAGDGSDVIVYSVDGGKDIVNYFDPKNDVIRLSDTTVAATDFSEKGNDVILTIGKGSITLKNSPRGTINVINEDGLTVEYKTLPTGVTYKKNVVTLGKTFTDTSLSAADLGLTVKEINASAVATSVELRADSDATKLTASKGGSLMIGGKGADTMIGGNGNDTFAVGVGADFIDKYTAGKDVISIVGGLSAGKASGSNVELTTSDGTVTIKGVVGKELTVSVDDEEQKYKFAKTTTTLADALIVDAAQLPSEDYWFMSSTVPTDELGELVGLGTSTDEAALDLSTPKEFSLPSAFNNITYGRRSTRSLK